MTEKLHIIAHKHAMNKYDKNRLHGHRSMVVWFTGLSGSGKSTLANALEAKLHHKGVSTYILDGDNIRKGLNKDLDFSAAGRVENIRRIGEVAHLFIDAGVVVLSAFVSPFASDRKLVKDLVGAENFVEVFVDCPLEICEERDTKGLYKMARKGEISNFTGISSPFESPKNADIHIRTNTLSIEESVEVIFQDVLKKVLL